MRIPKVKCPWNQQLGAIGESAIKTRLRYFSNPTKYEMDLGLDFYCELIEDDSPSDPFYVQAKSTQHFDKRWGSSIPKSTITYWLQRAHPVFLVVYDEKTDTCYWMSVEDYRYELIQQIFASDSTTVYFKVNRTNVLERGHGKNEVFIAKVREDEFSIQLFRGRPQFIGQRYVKRVPSPPRTDSELYQTKENVRASLYSLIHHYWEQSDLETAYTYCQFLSKFDKSHYNHFVWLGRLAKHHGELELARESFRKAWRICQEDKIWPRDSMASIIASIENEMQDL